MSNYVPMDDPGFGGGKTGKGGGSAVHDWGFIEGCRDI